MSAEKAKTTVKKRLKAVHLEPGTVERDQQMQLGYKLKLMAQQWFEKHPDAEPDPYLLTPEIEQEIRDFEIEKAKKHMSWRLAQRRLPTETILLKISQVDWSSKIDFKPIFEQANRNKNHELWLAEDNRKRKAELAQIATDKIIRRMELKATYTYKRFYSILNWTSQNIYGKNLIVNPNTLPTIKTICYFLSRDEKLETELGFSLNKGLWLQGPVGLGKTYLIECLKDNELSPIKIFNLVDIAKQIKSDGSFEIPIKENEIIYLDDVGAETQIIKFYGTTINFFQEFIELHYKENKIFNNLIVSTNCDFDNIEDKYGVRVRSRVREMFNIFDAKGSDMRK